ncbi:MAG: chitobiase/beta-hexosaminidase C-terminal domain-containing protein [Sedimentisphaerales bacterium]|nr:chitobiase/beta-hexosaminidase C-terminal domain-containing protein [Sedimentisphaerales bacterium]
MSANAIYRQLTFLLLFVASANGALRIDFTQTTGPVELGYQGYFADHESAATFTQQYYSAFGTTVAVVPVWPANPAGQAMQMIDRSSGSSLLTDWIGTDARVPSADPLVLVVSGLLAGSFWWTSYHHDPQDQTGLFDVTVTDAAGSVTTKAVDISNGALNLNAVTKFETTIVSDGVNPVFVFFDNRGYANVSEAFFVMNALELEALDPSYEEPPPVAGPNQPSVAISEFVASNDRTLADGDGNTPDWIELYNGTSRPVSLAGWCLTDNARDLQKWPFPPGTTLLAGGYLVVFASGHGTTDYVDAKGSLHTNFALDKSGEYLALVGPDGVVHEYAPCFPLQQADVSYGLWQGQLQYFAPPTPGRANARGFRGLTDRTKHSHERGFYDEAFDLWISCATPDVSIRYTLDGSEPTDHHGIVYDPSAPIRILTTTCVRSVAYRVGWKSPEVTTHTYIFVDDVARQPANPPGWPGDWGYDSEVRGTVPADYEMDPRVVDSALPGYSIRDALLDVPTLSISMLPDDFIGQVGGIYTHPQSRWERQCSIEYILPDASGGFQCDCKIEVHGNSSRRPWRMQKHSMRLTFTSQYGPAKLDYPLFPESDVQEFNQLVLRASFTDSWALVSWSSSRYRPNDSQYIRDVWMKESLREMGQPSSHGRFVHVYFNGLYFGIFNLTERVDADFFADHLGGRPEDWEVNEDLSSPGSRWRAMVALDPSTPAGYAQIQEYLDVNDLADYMLLHFYADAEDWPHHNGYAAANAASDDGKFRFFVWDQEIVLDYHGRAASRIDSTGGVGDLFQKMRTSDQFRLLFADRVYRHCFNGGALSLPVSQDRYLRVANWIDKAIVAESARWGDTQMSTPYGNTIEQPNPPADINHNLYPPAPHGPDYYFTRGDSWVVERDNIIANYLPAIHNTANSYALLTVLRARALYPNIDPPEFRIDGINQHGGPVLPGAVLTLHAAADQGAIYYTLDGSDPRVPPVGAQPGASHDLVSEQAAKRVLVPTGDIGSAWTGGTPYDDAGWLSGTGGVGYEMSSGYESLIGIDVGPPMYSVSTSCYLRIPFTITAQDLRDLGSLALDVRYDDGFVAYINGVEVCRGTFAGTPRWDSAADGSHSDVDAVYPVSFNVTAGIEALRAGENILAIQGLNASATSSDFLISAALSGREGSPTGPGDPSISPTAARYVGSIALTQDTWVKARVLYNGQWSALHEAVYSVDAHPEP